jgi:hypothetical protein
MKRTIIALLITAALPLLAQTKSIDNRQRDMFCALHDFESRDFLIDRKYDE